MNEMKRKISSFEKLKKFNLKEIKAGYCQISWTDGKYCDLYDSNVRKDVACNIYDADFFSNNRVTFGAKLPYSCY